MGGRAVSVTTTDDAPAGVDELDYRAATECLTVLSDQGRAHNVPGFYLVVSESGREYLVDGIEQSCECPDFEFRDRRCKHLRRCAFATEAREVPDEIDDEEVDDQLGIHVE